MFANIKIQAFTYDKQHQDYLYVTDKATFFSATSHRCHLFFVLKII
jgi:hypothetical protein